MNIRNGSSRSNLSDIEDQINKSGHSFRGNESIAANYSTFAIGSTRSFTRPFKDDYISPVVALKEDRAVLFARLVVVVVLIIALAVVTLSVYWVVSGNQRREFETQFDNFTSEMTSLIQYKCKNAIDSAEYFSVMITSSAIITNSSWPYVSIEDFTSKAKRLSTLSGAYQVGFAPIVLPEDFNGWKSHSLSNLPTYYDEAIKINDYNTSVEELMIKTNLFPWFLNESSSFGVPKAVDPLEPEAPLMVGLRERIGFRGFWVNWQSLTWLEPYYTYLGGLISTNLNLLTSGFEDAFATAYEFNIPAFGTYRYPIIDPVTKQLLRWEIQGTQMVQPVFDTIYNGERSRNELKMVGALNILFDWGILLSDLLSKADIRDVDIVLSSTCSMHARPVTYRITDAKVVEVDKKDLHDPKYDSMGFITPLFQLDLDKQTQFKIDKVMAEQIENSVGDGCISEIMMAIYPTQELEESFYTNTSWKLSFAVAAVFASISLVFFVYDITVKRRQAKVMERIIRQDKIVLNTFPRAIRDRLYNNQNSSSDASWEGSHFSVNAIFGSGALAELYPSATVVFAEIVGFTAWSSAREPNQVFKLLETIYREFDKIAYRNNIFKVETVSDCYVAVAGLPQERGDHALAVAKFSRDCMRKMPDLVRKLEIMLGPDTADLQIRIGLNTGQITAGVLRGDKARFQLFGDTVNTASRMETTSEAGRIHVSASTADALIKAGRQRWLKPRKGTVHVKGKGHIQTYYLETLDESIRRSKLEKSNKPKHRPSMKLPIEEYSCDEESTSSSDETNGDDLIHHSEIHRNMSKLDRLVEWNVEILSFLLKQILAARPKHKKIENNLALIKFEHQMRVRGESPQTTALDEFKEIVDLRNVATEKLIDQEHLDAIKLSPLVIEQLRDLLKNIANMYNDNAFHNFEHASHVTASVRKLLTRIVDADHNGNFHACEIQNGFKLSDISGHSFGITSDPLTQFSVVFSAVIHDAGHPGVPNSQLVKENTQNAQHYRKSIAEQNSIEIIWKLLMSPAYDDLRLCIYSNVEELTRFRQLVVNTVLATDIVDKELQRLRKMRWEKAFSLEEQLTASTPQLDVNRKATIVIEHLIQASDIAHTMQHWTIYTKWNERFFFELYDAYKNGRAESDPSIGWYEGEIGFFDFYIIPLAKKLENCGVFGVSSQEYLSYAQNNREQWVREGKELVRKYLKHYNSKGKQDTEEVDIRPLSPLCTTESGYPESRKRQAREEKGRRRTLGW